MQPPHHLTDEKFATTELLQLQEQISSTGREIILPAGVTTRPREEEILIILSGQMTVSNARSDGLMLGHTFPLLPIGLLERYNKLDLYYQSETEVFLSQLTTTEFDNLFFNSHKNSYLLNQIMARLSIELIHIYYERNNDSGYATIRHMLYRYMIKSEEGILQNEGIASFILKRTRLSRSYVFQVLAALKSGGYITIKHGKLVSINREIPAKF